LHRALGLHHIHGRGDHAAKVGEVAGQDQRIAFLRDMLTVITPLWSAAARPDSA
jgi:hypothetical protein